MFSNRIHLFTMFGFSVKADISWFFIVALFVWLLAAAYFPMRYPELSGWTYLGLGLFGVIGLFVSIVLHEFCHAYVARRYGLNMRGITLWIFGGVAEMAEEPQNAKTEFLMAAAGPLASFVIAGFCYVMAATGERFDWNLLWTGPFNYLWQINLILAIFNLVPAFPLDGGRILRSMLWGWKGRLDWATKIASNIGSGFGFVLMFLGILAFIGGNFIGGMWYFFIGLFIRWAAKMSYTRLRINESLSGEPVSQLMTKPAQGVPESTTIDELIQQYVFRFHMSCFPVVNAFNEVTGLIGSDQIRKVPSPLRPRTTVDQVKIPLKPENSISVHADSADAFAKLSASENPKSLVVLDDNNKLAGMLSLRDLLNVVSLRLELRGSEDDISPDIRLPKAG